MKKHRSDNECGEKKSWKMSDQQLRIRFQMNTCNDISIMMTFDSGNIRSDNESAGVKNSCDEISLHHETRLLFKTTLTHPGNSKSEQQENNLMPANCLIKKFLPKRSLLQSFSSTRFEIVLMSIKYQPNDSHVCVGLFIRCAYYNFRS